MKKHYRKENNCANCGTDLQGKFCHSCGQENLELKENFGHMMSHAISDYFHFDHQFFHTLKPLFLQPGRLTTEYMAGRRVQYLHPVKMYIFISLIFFLLFFKSSHDTAKVKLNNGKPVTKADLIKANKQLEAGLKDPDLPAFAKPLLEKAKEENADKLKDSLTTGDIDIDDDDVVTKKTARLPGASHDSTYRQYLANQAKLPADKKDGYLFRAYNKKSFDYKEKYGERAKEVFFEDIKHNVPKMMFLLLPLCALIFKITFWRNRKFYVEHLIFTFHLHCFIFTFLAILMLLQMIMPDSWELDGWFSLIGFIGITWYLYRALRVFYQRGRWRTVSKMVGSGVMYFMAFVFCITIIGLITAIV
jgi:hypothetical protein